MKNQSPSITSHCLLMLLVGLGIALLVANVSSAAGNGFSQQRELRGRTPDGKLQPLPPSTGERVLGTMSEVTNGMSEWLGPNYSAGDSIKETAGQYSTRTGLKHLIREAYPGKDVNQIYKNLPKNIKEVAKPLETAGKTFALGDQILTAEESIVSLGYGDKIGSVQAVANSALNGAAATGGAWVGGKGGAAAGLALGGPPGAVVGAGVGAVAGAVAGSYTYDKYGKPIIDKTANAASRKATDYLEETENECRRLRTDLMLLRDTPYANDIVNLDRILYLDKERRDYGWRLESLPISQQLSEKDKQEIHRRAEEVRAKQAEERARDLPSEKVGDRITDLDRQWKATTDPEARKRIEYEMSLLNKRLEDAKKAAGKTAQLDTKIEKCVCGSDVKHEDSDGDQVPDCIDLCKSDSAKTEPGICGCGTPDTDRDGDGTLDCKDNCPDDPLKTEAGICGCGTPDTDTDGDFIADCNDDCPGTSSTEMFVDARGCSSSQLDLDYDGVSNNRDRCPGTPQGEKVNSFGCSVSQMAQLAADSSLDSDYDGVSNGEDRCPGTPQDERVNSIGCSINQLAQLAADKDSQGQEKSEKDKQYYETGRKIGEALGKALLGAAAVAAGAKQPTQPTQPTKPAGKKPTASPKPPSTTKPGGTPSKYPEGAFSGSWSELRGTIKDPTGKKSVPCNTVVTGGPITMNVHTDGTVEGNFYNDIQSTIYRIKGTVDSSGKLNATANCYNYKESVCWKEISYCTLKGTLRMDGSRPTGSGTLTCGPNSGTSYCTGSWGR